MIYLKLMPIENVGQASRNLRELAVAREMGYDTLIFATTKERKSFRGFQDGHEVRYIPTRRLGQKVWMRLLNQIISFIEFVVLTVRTDAAIISGNNFIVTLAAYIANWFKPHEAKLIYDSHEFELYQDPNRSKFTFWFIKCVEGFLLRHVDLSLMVGDKIADGVQEVYKLETRPTVIRNIPPYWRLGAATADIRKQFLTALDLPKDGFLFMYHGRIAPGRGCECIINALSLLPGNIGVVFVGDETVNGMVNQLQKQARQLNVEKRVLFRGAVPINELKDYVGVADIEVILIEGKKHRSFEYCLPNKFFESIQACVPMICSDLPEMRKLVCQYDIGILVNEDDEKGVAEAVINLQNDKERYDRLKRNLESAKRELCWEQESIKLKTAIQGIMGEH